MAGIGFALCSRRRAGNAADKRLVSIGAGNLRDLKQGLPRARLWLGAVLVAFLAFNVVWAAWAHGYYEVMWNYCEPDRRFRGKPGISCARGRYAFAVARCGS